MIHRLRDTYHGIVFNSRYIYHPKYITHLLKKYAFIHYIIHFLSIFEHCPRQISATYWQLDVTFFTTHGTHSALQLRLDILHNALYPIVQIEYIMPQTFVCQWLLTGCPWIVLSISCMATCSVFSSFSSSLISSLPTRATSLRQYAKLLLCICPIK